jgi:putative tryptophan/tyrosine transport system substrate-binding protein
MQFDQLKRREFITLLGGAATAWPLAARAQQTTMPVIGYLDAGSPQGMARDLAGFRSGLSETGYAEGRNVTIEYRWAEGHYDRLPALAADLVRRHVTVIAATNTSGPALAAKAATSAIPIVFQTGADPVHDGLVSSLSRPGGNVTGVTSMNADIMAKRLGLLHELVPAATHFGLLVNPRSSFADSVVGEVRAAGLNIGQAIEVLSASTNHEIDSAFASLVQKRLDALLVSPDGLFHDRHVQLVTLAAHHRVPTIYYNRSFAESGGLLSYGTSTMDQYRQVGVYVGRILKGDKPSDLPVQRAANFEFIINLQTAKTLGIAVPPTLLARADEVIE